MRCTMPLVLLAAVHALGVESPLRLRVVSFNVHAFRDADHRDSLDRLCTLLREVQPDVVCLNEVLHPWAAPSADDEYWDAVRARQGYGRVPPLGSLPLSPSSTHLYRLAQAAGLKHVVFGCASPERSFFGRVPFGNAVLSRYELESVVHGVMRPDPAVDLHLGDQPRTLHDLEDRGVTTATVVLPGGRRVGVCVTHLDHKAEELREKQARQVLAAARAAFRPPSMAADAAAGATPRGDAGSNVPIPFFICGDLNSYDRRDMSNAQWIELCALCDSKGWGPPREHSLVRSVLEDEGGLVDAFQLAPRRNEADIAPADFVKAAAAAEPPSAFSSSAAAAVCPMPPPSTPEGRAPPTCWTGARLDYLLLDGAAGRARVDAHRTMRESTCSDHVPLVCDLLIR